MSLLENFQKSVLHKNVSIVLDNVLTIYGLMTRFKKIIRLNNKGRPTFMQVNLFFPFIMFLIGYLFNGNK